MLVAFLINPGGANDKESIALATRLKTHIPNWQRKPERSPESMQAALEVVTKGHERRILRSLASTYNCIGMVFANRRTCIEPNHVPMILNEDGYVTVSEASSVMTGDIVVYELDGEVSHVAVVISNTPDLTNGSSNIQVLSQWGFDGEYLHDYRDVNEMLGIPMQFFSERRKM